MMVGVKTVVNIWNKKGSLIRSASDRAVVGALGVVRRVLTRVSDRQVVSLLRVVAGALPDRGARAAVEELADVFEAGPPGSDLVRRMVLESRDEEVSDLVGQLLFAREVAR